MGGADLRLYPTRNSPWVWMYNSDGSEVATFDLGVSRRPEPWDAGNMAAYIKLRNNRFTLTEMPTDGWPVSPAGYVAVVETINAANAAMDEIDRSGKGRLYSVDSSIPRVTFVKSGHVIDWYATHQVIWMKSEDVTQEYIAGLTDAGWWGIVTGAASSAGIAGVGLMFEIPWFISTPVGLLVSLAQWRLDPNSHRV